MSKILECVFGSKNQYEIGVDECARGPMFGRLYTAAVILPKDTTFHHEKMKDSKKIKSRTIMKELSNYIKENINHECEVRFSALWWNNECDFEPHYYTRDIAKDTSPVWIFFPHENWWEGSIS